MVTYLRVGFQVPPDMVADDLYAKSGWAMSFWLIMGKWATFKSFGQDCDEACG